MNDESKSNLKVGVFLLVGLILLLGTILFLGGNRLLFSNTANFKTSMTSTQGLAVGSIISLSGIVVGNIKDISFSDTDNSIIVTFSIAQELAKKITLGTTTEVRTQGALGDKYIYIEPGPAEAEVLAEGSILPRTESNDFIGVLSRKADEATKVFEVIAEANLLLKTLNRGNRIDTILNNFSETSLESKKLVQDIRSKNIDKLSDSITKLDKILIKIDRGEGSLGALINDPSIHDQLKSMLGGSDRKTGIKNVIKSSIAE